MMYGYNAEADLASFLRSIVVVQDSRAYELLLVNKRAQVVHTAMKSVLVIICLIAVGKMSAGSCSVPFMFGDFGDCSASSAAEIYFSDSIDISACQLFGDLDFNSTNFTNSWPNITDTCIQQSLVLSMFLYHTTPSGPGRPLSVAQCQTYEQTMQCRMDCLLTFEIFVPNELHFAYIHLRAISCDKTLFNSSIGTIFNNLDNIQPSFIQRLWFEVISSLSTFTTAPTTNQLVLQSSIISTKLSATTSIQYFLSSNFPSPSQLTNSGSSIDVGTTAAFSTAVAVLIIIALGTTMILVLVLIRHRAHRQNTNENAQVGNNAAIPTNPNPVYGYLPDSEAEIPVDLNLAYEESKTLPITDEQDYDVVDIEPVYDTVDTISVASTHSYY